MRTPTDIRLAMRANGYDPLPAPHQGKECFLLEWRGKIGLSAEEIRLWDKEHPDWRNSGCNATRTGGFDIDLKDPEAGDAIRRKICSRFDGRGEILERTGEAPKFLVPFRVEKPFGVLNQWFLAPNGTLHLLQFLCDGQQFICHGTHQGTGKPYSWRNGRDLTNTLRSALPEIEGTEAQAFFCECCKYLVSEFGYTLTDRFGKAVPNVDTAHDRKAGNGHDKAAAVANIDIDADIDADIETILTSAVGGNFNAIYCHVAPKLFCRGWHPDEVINYLHGHFMRRAQILGLPWKDKAEKQRAVLTGRVKATLKYLAKGFDHHSGEIPLWVAPEFQADWVRVMARGNRPEIRFDGQGWQVYEIETAATADNTSTPATEAAKPAGKKLIIPLSAAEWITRDLPPVDRLMGAWQTTTSRTLLSADTGLGKTNLCMACSAHRAAGVDFLHWHAHRPARSLYIDGEMSRTLLKERIADATRRLGSVPDGWYVLSSEDIENFPPLNTPEGIALLNMLLDQLGSIEFIDFDNCMALLTGDHKDEIGWTQAFPLVMSLTKRRIGQLWIHHTGHDTSRSYGTKTREWRMDTTIHLTGEERDDVDISFKLEFRKARERTPSNRADFESVTIALVDDRWETTGRVVREKGKPSDAEAGLLRVFDRLIKSPAMFMHKEHMAIHGEQWQSECLRQGVAKTKNFFTSYRCRLVNKNLIECDSEISWRT